MLQKIATYDDLLDVSVCENGEDLLVVQEELPKIICSYKKHDMLPILGEKMLLRASVIKKLALAQTLLEQRLPDAQLKLVYGYRHPDVQSTYFNSQKQELHSKKDLSEPEAIRKAHLLSASPDVAGHPTGGAIDVTIAVHGDELDMGTPIADFSDTKRIQTFFDGIDSVQKEHRMLLREILTEVGFAPFDYEWWHFSYGDREWAFYYDKPNALYDAVHISKKKTG